MRVAGILHLGDLSCTRCCPQAVMAVCWDATGAAVPSTTCDDGQHIQGDAKKKPPRHQAAYDTFEPPAP